MWPPFQSCPSHWFYWLTCPGGGVFQTSSTITSPAVGAGRACDLVGSASLTTSTGVLTTSGGGGRADLATLVVVTIVEGTSGGGGLTVDTAGGATFEGAGRSAGLAFIGGAIAAFEVGATGAGGDGLTTGETERLDPPRATRALFKTSGADHACVISQNMTPPKLENLLQYATISAKLCRLR